MLDLYKRECPKCAAPLPARPMFCPACRKLLPRGLSGPRRIVENTSLAVLLAAFAFGLLAPDAARRILHRPPASTGPAPVIRLWSGPGPEPAARSWALPLEESLRSVCRNTLAIYSDRKIVVAVLTQQLPGVTREQRLPLTPQALQLAPEEEKEAAAIFADGDGFTGECLRRGYAALAVCEPYRGNLIATDATQCIVNAVEGALVSAPFAYCASAAKLQRVQRACGLAADYASRQSRGKHGVN